MTVSIPTVVEAITQPLVDRVRTWVPGEVVSYDRRTRRATVKALARLLVLGDDGNESEREIPPADMPVEFFRSGGFTVLADLEKGNRGKIHYTCMPLDTWKRDGKTYAVRMGRYALGDACFDPGLTDYGAGAVECPAGQMIVGAEDGPRVVVDRPGLRVTVSAKNEVQILGGALVRIESRGNVFIQGRRVNPLGGEI